MCRAARLCLLLVFVCVVAPAQEKPPADPTSNQHELRKGELVPSVRCADKPEQSYALYVPSNYAPDRRWPIIYVFDPAARGNVPLGLMKDAAERYGYLLAGSNNSRNGPWQPELAAAQAMWNDTHGWLSIDDRRVYFAGFSGGARFSAQLAQLCKCAQGVFLGGAGFAPGVPPSREVVFPVFATVGLTDFNYGELVELDVQLEALGFPRFLRRFDGPHAWAPADVWEEAFAWMALLAMKDGRGPRDDAFVAAELAHATERGRKLESTGDAYYAWQQVRESAAAFDGLADTAALHQRVAELEKNPAVRASRKREKADIEIERGIEGEIFRITDGLHDSQADRYALRADAGTQIRRLRGDVSREKRAEARRVLERALAGVFAAMIQTGEPLLDAGDHSAAQPYLQLAVEARPDWPRPHLSLARCLVLLGDKKNALRELSRAREVGLTVNELAEFVKTKPALAALTDAPEYQKLLTDAPANRAAPK